MKLERNHVVARSHAGRKIDIVEMFIGSEIALQPVTRRLPNVMQYSNAVEMGLAKFAEAALQRTYAPREIDFNPVRLGRLPFGALVYGGLGWLADGDAFAVQQISPLEPFETTLRHVTSWPWPTCDIDGPCFLATRYGENVWGHWACEILPAVAVAERAFPGRFRFAIGAEISGRTEHRSYATTVLESLDAYGIDEGRLIRLDAGTLYRFQDLHAVSGLWSAACIHPGALETMRNDVECAGAGRDRIAAMRSGKDATRQIHNLGDVADLLDRDGFYSFDPATIPFKEQIGLFRDATEVFSVLGSTLSGLMYSPDEVRVVSAAPGDWPDAYFSGIMQLRNASYADLRGCPLWTGDGLERDAPILVNQGHLRRAIDAVREPHRASFGLGDMAVPRTIGPMHFEIDFSAVGNSAAFRGVGWSFQEESHVWSEGSISTLVIPQRNLPSGDFLMDVSVFAPVAPPHLAFRRLEIEVNGMPLGDYKLAGLDRVLCPVAASHVIDGALSLVLRHPFCLPARNVGLGLDDRVVSAAFLKIAFRLP